MDKKALSDTTLVLLVIALISLAVFGPTILSFADSIKYGTDKTACKNSVQLKAASKLSVLPNTEIVPVPLKCSSKYQFIKNEKDLENAKKMIANDIYDCWDQFGEGKVDFIFERDFFEEEYCFICSKISVTEPSLQNKEILGLGDYLLDEKIPLSDKTYANFLRFNNLQKEIASFANKQISIEDYLRTLNKIPVKDPIYIIYHVRRSSIPKLSLLGTGVGIGSICAAGLFTGYFTLPAAFCLIGTIAPGIASIESTNTYYYPSLIIVNSKEAVIRCREK